MYRLVINLNKPDTPNGCLVRMESSGGRVPTGDSDDDVTFKGVTLHPTLHTSNVYFSVILWEADAPRVLTNHAVWPWWHRQGVTAESVVLLI